MKYMHRTNTGHKSILVVVDEVTLYFLTIPLYKVTSNKKGKTLINHSFGKHGLTMNFIFDEDQTFYQV